MAETKTADGVVTDLGPAFVIVVAGENHHVWECDGWTCDFTDNNRHVQISAEIHKGAEVAGRRGLSGDAANLAMAVLKGDTAAALLLADLVSEQYVAGL